MLKFFRNQLTAQLLWECSAISEIEFVRLSSIFVQDPKIVGPDQTSNRINWSVFTLLILEALDARQIAETLIFEQEKMNYIA